MCRVFFTSRRRLKNRLSRLFTRTIIDYPYSIHLNHWYRLTGPAIVHFSVLGVSFAELAGRSPQMGAKNLQQAGRFETDGTSHSDNGPIGFPEQNLGLSEAAFRQIFHEGLARFIAKPFGEERAREKNLVRHALYRHGLAQICSHIFLRAGDGIIGSEVIR